jgi:pimeloyl-ACP methyl ester carboxylesterase
MTAAPMPPMRTSHTRRTPQGLLSYDLWGVNGRPVLLLPALLFDRVMWWPVAADLRPYATVIAPDLPGHGDSTRPRRYDPDDIVADLAELVDHLGVRQAPVVVGHASAAALAERFAASYATHAVITVDPLPSVIADAPADPDSYLAAMQLDAIPQQYRELIRPAADTSLWAAYTACRSIARQPNMVAAACTHLTVYSNTPAQLDTTTAAPAPQRNAVYDVAGRFPHLANVTRFVSDLRSLL